MTKETKTKEEAREAKPKYRSVIPADFKIRRSPSPMSDILREAESTESSSSLEPSSSPETLSSPELLSSLEITEPVAKKSSTLEAVSSVEATSLPTNNLAAFAESLSY